MRLELQLIPINARIMMSQLPMAVETKQAEAANETKVFKVHNQGEFCDTRVNAQRQSQQCTLNLCMPS